MSGEHSVWWPTWEKYMHFLEWFTTLPLWAFPHQWIPHIFKPIARFCTPGSVKSQAHSHCLLLIVYHSEEGKQDLPQYEQCGFFCLFSFWGLHPSSPLRLSCCAASAQNLRVYEVVVEVLACPGTNHILSHIMVIIKADSEWILFGEGPWPAVCSEKCTRNHV